MVFLSRRGLCGVFDFNTFYDQAKLFDDLLGTFFGQNRSFFEVGDFS